MDRELREGEAGSEFINRARDKHSMTQNLGSGGKRGKGMFWR